MAGAGWSNRDAAQGFAALPTWGARPPADGAIIP
jgi:hypothetical protein